MIINKNLSDWRNLCVHAFILKGHTELSSRIKTMEVLKTENSFFSLRHVKRSCH